MATIKSFKLNLDQVSKGKPTPVTMSCVYSSSSKGFDVGYVLGVDDTVTEIRCFPLGLSGQLAFMNTDKQTIELEKGSIISYRLGFAIKDGSGQLSGWMMQGENGDNIVGTKGFEDLLAASQEAKY